MPILIQKSIFENVSFSIWKIDESEDFFYSNINLTENCKKRLNSMNSSQKRKQFLAVRKLIKLYDIDLNDLEYNPNGAPELKNGKKISISHTNGFSAIAISKKPAGIDIQDYRKKILSVSHKFLNESEKKIINSKSIKELTLIWSIKESIYKTYQKSDLSFKRDIEIKSFEDDFKYSSVILNKSNKKTFFKSKNIIQSDYICSIVTENE